MSNIGDTIKDEIQTIKFLDDGDAWGSEYEALLDELVVALNKAVDEGSFTTHQDDSGAHHIKYSDSDAVNAVNDSDITPSSVSTDKVSANLNDTTGDQSLVQAGTNERSTSDGIMNVVEANLSQQASGASDGGLRGFNSLVKQHGADCPTFGMHSKVRTSGTASNQGIAFYGEVDNMDGSVGSLPPTTGIYLDSRASTVRPFAAFVDDGESFWQHGIVMNGDYSDTLIRHDNYTVDPDGSVTRGPTDDPQPRMRTLHRDTPDSGVTEDFNLNTVIDRSNESWMIHVSSNHPDSETSYTNRGFEGMFRYWVGYNDDGSNYTRVTPVVPLTGFDSTHSCSVNGGGTISYSGGSVSKRAEIVVQGRKLS